MVRGKQRVHRVHFGLTLAALLVVWVLAGCGAGGAEQTPALPVETPQGQLPAEAPILPRTEPAIPATPSARAVAAAAETSEPATAYPLYGEGEDEGWDCRPLAYLTTDLGVADPGDAAFEARLR